MISFGPKSSYIEVYDRPGRYLNQRELAEFHSDILSVAQECLDEIPHYQCLTGSRREYERLIIAVARAKDGTMLGFCSSYILEGGDLGNILHLGLTCVHPRARRMGLTHKLTSKVVMTYLVRHSLFKPTWISNVACVLSSLGNVAMHFEKVHPSPYFKAPSEDHFKVAKLIDQQYRWELFVNKDATFNANKFIFERSVCGTVFEKSEADLKYHHRNRALTNFYLNIIDFQNGDEVLQIGKVSLFTFPKYLLKKVKRLVKPTKIAEPGQIVA